jgi:branched-subunit amino acid ABC-type transport system permease component
MSLIFDGMAYGMVLFVISVGLSVTMGMMGFVNLAHGAFAMAGGYALYMLVKAAGIDFFAALVLAAVIVGAASIVLERLLYRHVYGGTDVDQVMLTIGILFMAIAATTYAFGPEPQAIRLPAVVRGNFSVGGVTIPSYRAFIVGVGAVLIVLLWFGLERTTVGAKIRASVDNYNIAQTVGINVSRLFMLTFAVGSGLAAMGGGLAVEVLGLTPRFGLQYLVMFLIVVAVGGLGSIRGAFVAALALGFIDNAGKFFLPQGGGFFIYAVTLALLLWRPQGLFGRQEMHEHGAGSDSYLSIPVWVRGKRFAAVGDYLKTRYGLRWVEALPWVLAVAVYFLLPDRLAFAGQVLIMVLFALSLDLIFGYAGLITLGHAAFFGIGAYAAGLLSARLGVTEPFTGLAFGIAVAGAAGLAIGSLLVRYRALTFLMLTLATSILLYEFANLRADVTGGFDGLTGITVAPLFGVFDYDLWGRTHYLYVLAILVVGFVFARRISTSWFGQSLTGIRENLDRMPALGCPVNARLTIVYGISAAMAGAAGALYTQTNTFVSLSVLSFERSGVVLTVLVLAGAGRLYGAFLGAVIYMVLEDELSKLNPHLWEFGVGLTLVLIVLFAKGGIFGLVDRATLRLRRWTAP